jgi:DinB superfamily
VRDWIDEFRRTVTYAADRLRQIPEAQSGQSIDGDAWCAKEIIGHLIDSAANNHARFVLAQTKGDLVFPGYEQDRWVEIQDYRGASWWQLVDLWRAYNLHLAHVMSGVSDERLRRPCAQHTLETIAFKTVDKTEPATLEYLMKDYIDHLKHHLKQIFDQVPAGQ